MDRAAFIFLFWLVYYQSQNQRVSAKIISASILPKNSLGTQFLNETLPKECEGLGFCEKSKNYPKELAQQLIRELEQANMSPDSDGISLEQRFSDDWTTNPCNSKPATIIPFIIRDSIDGNWYYVLNSEINPIQMYNVQLCQHKPATGNHGQECRQIILDDDYNSQCVQKNVTRTILVIKNGNLFAVSTDIPSCCTCVAILKDK